MQHCLESAWHLVQRWRSPGSPVRQAVFVKPDAAVEAALIPISAACAAPRTIVSCATMCGCPIGCRFCGAGGFFARNLTAAEIVSQAVTLLEDERPPIPFADAGALQIRLDRMGEPTLNRAIAPALLELGARYPQASLLFCTSAPSVPWDWLLELGRRLPRLDVQFSVHETTDRARHQRIPFRRKMDLVGIAAAGAAWRALTGRKAGFNYCAHPDNATDGDADRLAGLLDPGTWNATVSVTFATVPTCADGLVHPVRLAEAFAGKLRARAFATEIFHPPGVGELGAGPGQLWHAQRWAGANPGRLCRRIAPWA